MLLDDSVDGGKPEPGALADRLGGEERFVDPLQQRGGDSASRVFHHDPDQTVIEVGGNP